MNYIFYSVCECYGGYMDIRKLLCEDEKARKYVSGMFSEIKNEFEGNSDRGITVIAASIIDTLIEDLLEGFLVPFESKNDRKNIFSSAGPLSNLSHKIEMAFSMGLLSVFDKKLLKTIVSVRNKFAHQISGISFKNEDIVNLCKKLVIPDNLLVSMDIEHKEDGRVVIYKPQPDDYRGWFQTAVYVAMTIIPARKQQFYRYPMTTPKDIKHRAEFSRISIESAIFYIDDIEKTILAKDEYKLTEDKLDRLNQMLEKQSKILNFFEQEEKKALNAKIIEESNIDS